MDLPAVVSLSPGVIIFMGNDYLENAYIFLLTWNMGYFGWNGTMKWNPQSFMFVLMMHECLLWHDFDGCSSICPQVIFGAPDPWPPLLPSGQSSWLQNGDVLWFLWGTNWIHICYVEESRPPLWFSGQSSWLQIQRLGFDFRRYQTFWNGVHSASWIQLRSYLKEKVEAPV
jgi:hypothetical protein